MSFQAKKDFMMNMVAPQAVQEASCAAAQDKYGKWLSSQPGFQATGVGVCSQGAICLKIYTNGMTDKTKEVIKKKINDVPIDFEEMGQMTTLPVTP